MYTPAEIANRYAEVGAAKTKLSIAKMLILGIFAGIFIALGAVGSQVVAVGLDKALGRFLGALVFPVGLMMVLVAGAELFTGNNLIFLSVLSRKATFAGMLRNWFFVYIGNFIGSLLVAFVLPACHGFSMYDGTAELKGKLAETVVSTANAKAGLSFGDAFLRGILCNFLVCIAVWVSFAAKDLAGKILGLVLPIMLFVLSGYEHSVANMYFVPAGIFTAQFYGLSANAPTWGAFLLGNLLPVTLGNIVGGCLLVAGGYYLVYIHGTDK